VTAGSDGTARIYPCRRLCKASFDRLLELSAEERAGYLPE
jgi:hypothetical protein